MGEGDSQGKRSRDTRRSLYYNYIWGLELHVYLNWLSVVAKQCFFVFGDLLHLRQLTIFLVDVPLRVLQGMLLYTMCVN